MITHADSVLITVNNVFNTDAQLEIQTSIANLNTTISNFLSISETIDNSLAEDGALNQTIDNLAKLTDDLSVVSTTLKDANLGVTFDDLDSAVSNLSQILDRIERGEGSLGQLVTKDDLYQSLEQTNKQIQLLLEDMRLNPKRYVNFSLFGKKQVKYKPSDLQTE